MLFSKLQSGRFPSDEFIRDAVAQFLKDATVKTQDRPQSQQDAGNKCVMQ